MDTPLEEQRAGNADGRAQEGGAAAEGEGTRSDGALCSSEGISDMVNQSAPPSSHAIQHRTVLSPKYVRSQGLGLSRSSSSSFSSKPTNGHTQHRKIHTVSNKSFSVIARSDTLPSFPSSESSEAGYSPHPTLPSTVTVRKHRSDSMPSFAFLNGGNDTIVRERHRQNILFEYGQPEDVHSLPPDPRTWPPSSLAVYVRLIVERQRTG